MNWYRYPPSELRHKFLMAKESDAILLDEHALPEGWVMMPLPGHSFDMVGFRTPDDIVYLAWLEGSGKVRSEISDNRLIWTAV